MVGWDERALGTILVTIFFGNPSGCHPMSFGLGPPSRASHRPFQVSAFPSFTMLTTADTRFGVCHLPG